jgi:G3E family GTPase
LLQATERLDRDAQPDVYLAEPVGSCTDLVATVVYPLEQMVGHRYSIAPLSVLVDPIRAQRFLGILTGKTFSPKVNYIYDKQLEEADLIVINKKELLDAQSLDRLTRALQDRYPKSRVLSLSARTGEGLEDWFTILSSSLESSQQQDRTTMEVDYEVYAQGEALLGWVNYSWRLSGREFDGNEFLKGLLGGLHERFADRISIAHLKGTLVPDQGNDIAVANLVREDGIVEQSHHLLESLESGELTLNLRAEADPEMLSKAVEASLQKGCEEFRLTSQVIHSAAFRPLPPTPTHRLLR